MAVRLLNDFLDYRKSECGRLAKLIQTSMAFPRRTARTLKPYSECVGMSSSELIFQLIIFSQY